MIGYREIITAAVSIVLRVLALYLLFGLQFTVDARMIPESMSDIHGMVAKLREWHTMCNNGQTSGGWVAPQIRTFFWLSVGSAGVALTASRKLTAGY